MTGKIYPFKEEQPLVYSFISKGVKGEVEKIIRYDWLEDDIYNLGFGDKIKGTNYVDDLVVTDNGDIRLVFTTVIRTLPLFFEKYPDHRVYFTGSDSKRINVYNYIIDKHIDRLADEYEFLGQQGKEFEPYQSNKKYEGFVIKKRIK